MAQISLQEGHLQRALKDGPVKPRGQGQTQHEGDDNLPHLPLPPDWVLRHRRL
jgi:hypothetical protein